MRILSLIWVAAASFAPSLAPSPSEDRPNFVIMMCDDQRWDQMGCAGNTVLKTPNMDRIAREGARFDNAFVATPVCSPSRAAFLTGRYGTQLGITDYLAPVEQDAGAGLPPGVPTWPEVLRKQGYATALIGK